MIVTNYPRDLNLFVREERPVTNHRSCEKERERERRKREASVDEDEEEGCERKE